MREADSVVVDPIDDMVVSWSIVEPWVATEVVGVLLPGDGGLVIDSDVACLNHLTMS